jgi:nucleoside-diphosphate-sugar epimerase
MANANGVFHVAGWYKVGSNARDEAHRVNVEGTRNVLEVMRDLEIPKGVYTSTLAVFSDTHGRLVDEIYFYKGPHLSFYDQTKWDAHYTVALPMMENGLPLVIVQPGLIYGPGDASLMHETLTRFVSGSLMAAPKSTVYCWSHVDDAAKAHILAMEARKPGETYIIAGPPSSLMATLELASEIIGIPMPSLRPNPALARFSAELAALAERVIPIPLFYRSEVLRSSAGVTYMGSNAKARTELGYAPRSLEEGLPPTLEWEMPQLKRFDGAMPAS